VANRTRLLSALVLLAVAVAFADSSIVVLALPELYGRFHTTIEGVAWVITGYNATVACSALALVPVARRVRPAYVLLTGLVVFSAASLACAVAGSLWFLITARCVQGVGAALLLAAALPVLRELAGSDSRARLEWTLAGTFGATLGPAIGGALTQAFDWRAIFFFQAPVGALAVVTALAVRDAPAPDDRSGSLRPAVWGNVAIGLVFGALAGVLFLVVLLLVAGWGYSPLGGAAVAMTLPVAALLARPLEERLHFRRLAGIVAGTALLALGLVALAVLPSDDVAYVVVALALCGTGVGLAIPPLSAASLAPAAGLRRGGAFTVGVRHLGLVAALAAVAPLLNTDLPDAGRRAELRATSILLDAHVGLGTKIPVAFDLANAFDEGRGGRIPDLAEPFDAHGADRDTTLAATRDHLASVVHRIVARSFRRSFLFCALLAGLAGVVVLCWRFRWVR
jgi:predicted MFS family arabinose efflux permease